jgi:hypothetical protein
MTALPNLLITRPFALRFMVGKSSMEAAHTHRANNSRNRNTVFFISNSPTTGLPILLDENHARQIFEVGATGQQFGADLAGVSERLHGDGNRGNQAVSFGNRNKADKVFIVHGQNQIDTESGPQISMQLDRQPADQHILD